MTAARRWAVSLSVSLALSPFAGRACVALGPEPCPAQAPPATEAVDALGAVVLAAAALHEGAVACHGWARAGASCDPDDEWCVASELAAARHDGAPVTAALEGAGRTQRELASALDLARACERDPSARCQRLPEDLAPRRAAALSAAAHLRDLAHARSRPAP